MKKVTESDRKTMADFEEACRNNVEPTPPTCHLKPMFWDECEFESWWECSTCGHTKLAHTNNYEH